mmetsp:Transcript_50794/g.147997  ORF Transcript_50794/g.147997 Transcript_50794/m.147997 type:complete len:256 (-) Transcript_50794:541-1308(-)
MRRLSPGANVMPRRMSRMTNDLEFQEFACTHRHIHFASAWEPYTAPMCSHPRLTPLLRRSLPAARRRRAHLGRDVQSSEERLPMSEGADDTRRRRQFRDRLATQRALHHVEQSGHQRRALHRAGHVHEEALLPNKAFRQCLLLVAIHLFKRSEDDAATMQAPTHLRSAVQHDFHNPLAVAGGAVNEHALRDVVAIGVRAEHQRVQHDGVHDLVDLLPGAVLHQTLHDAASVLVVRNLDDARLDHLIDDELAILGR